MILAKHILSSDFNLLCNGKIIGQLPTNFVSSQLNYNVGNDSYSTHPEWKPLEIIKGLIFVLVKKNKVDWVLASASYPERAKSVLFFTHDGCEYEIERGFSLAHKVLLDKKQIGGIHSAGVDINGNVRFSRMLSRSYVIDLPATISSEIQVALFALSLYFK